MIFGQNRQKLRQMYADAWRKAQSKEVLSPLQAQIVQVIEDHPEYQSTLSKKSLDVSFTAENSTTNLFLHMSLHLAIRDQISMNKPKGILDIFQFLIKKYSNNHEVEHRMLDCLAESLWEAQNRNTLPDEQKYLERLREIS